MSLLKRLLPYSPAVIAAAWLYWDVWHRLVTDWYTDDNYSHGFLIVPLAAYFAWERREALKSTRRKPRTLSGLAVVAIAMVLLVAGTLGVEFFLTRVSLVICLLGVVISVGGWRHARILAFPIAVLLLMIPLPAIVFNQIAFPLQLLASRFGESVVALAGVPVLREGNVIILASTTLEVAEACSGIRSLVSLLTLGLVYGYFTDPRNGVRTFLALVTIPIAIVANGLRVAGTAIIAHHFGASAASGFFHTFSGWMVFVTAVALLLLVDHFRKAFSNPRTALRSAEQLS